MNDYVAPFIPLLNTNKKLVVNYFNDSNVENEICGNLHKITNDSIILKKDNDYTEVFLKDIVCFDII